MFDLIICGGTVVDGTGSPIFRADIGVENGRISRIGNLSDYTCDNKIDARGKFVTPGFIDMHSHADTTVLAYPQMESMLHQGITTFVGCQCGHSIAPVGKYWEGSQAGIDLINRLTPKLFADMYDMDYYTETTKTLPLIRELQGYDPNFITFNEFLEKVDNTGISGNMITLIGYNTIRMNTCDPHKTAPPTSEQATILKEHIREAMEAGAFGMSVGLDYKPGVFTTTDELMEMAAELKPYDGMYFAHWRRTGARSGTPKKQKKIDGIIETLEIGLKAGIPVELSHLSSGYDIFPANDQYMQKMAAQRTLQVVDEYVKKGVRIGFDVIPNITGGTMIIPDLMAIFRPWYMYTDGIDLFVENLKHADYRDSIKEPILTGKFFRLNPLIDPDWDVGIHIIGCTNSEYIGKTVRDIAEKRGETSIDMVFNLLVEDPAVKVFRTDSSVSKEAVKTFLAHSLATVGNDTFVFAETSTVSYDPKKPNRKPNPNTYCGFIKFLLEFGSGSIAEKVRKLSGQPAHFLGLTDRGIIHEGYRADMVVLDINALSTNEDYINPSNYPSGIQHVFVNGVAVIKDEEHTGARPGGVIRRQSK